MTPDWLKYANQNATRDLPLSPDLTSALSFLPDMGVSMEVFSGGQPSEGPNRVGSHRHDHGGAADVFFYKNGRKLDWANPQDRPIFEQIVERAKANGVTGFGAGPGYMQEGSMHIGFGKPAVWGAGGRGANAPDWLRAAYNTPADTMPSFDPSAFGAIALDDTPAPSAAAAATQALAQGTPMPQAASGAVPFDPVTAGAVPFDPEQFGAEPIDAPAAQLHPFDKAADKPRRNPDGSVSTEVTRTVQIGGQWANIPSLWWDSSGEAHDLGQMNDDQLAAFAADYEKQTGQQFPRFSDIQSAESSAVARSAGGGAEQGPLADQPAQDEPSVMSDIGRSAVSGLRQGMEGLVALPGSLNSLGGRLATGAANYLGASPETANRLGEIAGHLTPFFGAPSGEQVKAATNALAGPAYQPQTVPGEYARTIGEFAPGALIPGGGSLVMRAANVAVPAVVSETAGQATKGTSAEPYARLAGGIAGGAATVGSKLALDASRGARNAVRTATNESLEQADQFGIPLTRGQASGNIKQLTREEDLRNLTGGEIAGRMVQNFDKTQSGAIDDAVGTIGQRIGRPSDDLAETVGGGVKKVANDFRAAGSAGFDKAFEGGGLYVRKDALNRLPQFVAGKLDEGGFILDSQLTPAASRAYREIRQAMDLKGALSPDNPSAATVIAGEAGDVAAINLKGLVQVRRRISQLKGTNPQDWTVLKQVKNAFDDWMDDAVDTALYSGSEDALQAYRKANKDWTEFRKLTRPKTGDAAGRIIEKMQRDDATPEMISNWLYGANIARPNSQAPNIANRLKSIFGADSPEFTAIRAGAWERLTQSARNGETLSPTKLANNIEDFVNGNGKSLSQALFKPAEIKEMRDFAKLLHKTVTPANATNPSRSGFTLARLMQGAMQAGSGLAGLHFGGPVGMIAGVIGQPILRGVKNVAAARNALAPVAKKPLEITVTKPANALVPAVNALNASGLLAPRQNALAPSQ